MVSTAQREHDHDHQPTRNAEANGDPTQTTTLRRRWSQKMGARFRDLKGLLREAVVKKDVLGLRQNAPEPGETPFMQARNVRELGAFEFATDTDKVAQFKDWIDEASQEVVLDLEPPAQLPEGAASRWTDQHVRGAYISGLKQSENKIKKAVGGAHQALSREVKDDLIHRATEAADEAVRIVHSDATRTIITQGNETIRDAAKRVARQTTRDTSRKLMQEIAEGKPMGDVLSSVEDEVKESVRKTVREASEEVGESLPRAAERARRLTASEIAAGARGGAREGGRRGIREGIEDVVGFSRNLENVEIPPIQQAMRLPVHRQTLETLYTRTFSELRGITESMGQQISRELADGVSRGIGPEAMARNLSDRVDKVGLHRGRVLARTETIRAHADASLNRFEQFGIDRVGGRAEWQTADDARVCPICLGLEGQIVPIEEARGRIPIHPQCRCSWLPIVTEENLPERLRNEADRVLYRIQKAARNHNPFPKWHYRRRAA